MIDDVKYDSFIIGSNEDLQVLFHYRRQFPKVRTPELLAKLVDVIFSLGGSNRNLQPSITIACSRSMPVGASTSVSVIEPEAVLVASPSIVIDLNHTRDGKVGDTGPFSDVTIAMAGTPNVVPDFRQGGALDGVKDVLQDDDVESTTIADDSNEDIASSTLVGGGRAASSGTQQYFPHFSTMDLDVMRQQRNSSVDKNRLHADATTLSMHERDLDQE
ncbi:hypothetical protein Ahy_B09g094937 [Arachis hypogaea]|uniref:Uncharacterized protein n=1 Tax=Arachis hypogaea TaxID=3818 RepID=A0A444XCT7_ARAHY|nr:hypothetical protein Ahy_B09g094937 [Arachis hypogaea]